MQNGLKAYLATYLCLTYDEEVSYRTKNLTLTKRPVVDWEKAPEC